MAVLSTMLSNDETIKNDSIVIKTWESRHNRLNESYLKVLKNNEDLKGVNDTIYKENKLLAKKVQRNGMIINLAAAVIIVETILYILK